MSEYGIKIKNYKAGSIYEVDCGVRNRYDSKDAMLTNSLFLDFLLENGLDVYKEVSTRDIICIDFDYGSRSYEEEIKHLNKIYQKDPKPSIQYQIDQANIHEKQFDKKSKEELRILMYENGVTIHYPIWSKGEITSYESIHYQMLYRSTGKAKKGSCMFICDRLYPITREFLYMGLTLPEENAPIVEIGAYSSLITSTIVDRITIDPEEILVVDDVLSYFTTNITSIELDENKTCRGVYKENYTLHNEMFDGQALIDSSIFPKDADGYILLRQHFTKMAAFCSHIQKFYQDQFGKEYETATVTDMWGNKHLAKRIKLITTNNALKWLKFNVSYEYWSEWVRKNNCQFGIVKTAHPSKLGDVQRMSYQMVNALSEDGMKNVLSNSVEYINKLKTDDTVFLDYLRRSSNFSNDFEVLIALYEQNPEFAYSPYFRNRRHTIIKTYVQDLRNGRAIQNADNLTIVGSPYAMLLHSIGKDPLQDPTFKQEDGATQCWTNRFNDGEYLAEFRSPFNGRANLGYLHNVYHTFFDRYFELGRLCVAVNMNGTDFQDKNNGLTNWVS